jgi:hypothetical protein
MNHRVWSNDAAVTNLNIVVDERASANDDIRTQSGTGQDRGLRMNCHVYPPLLSDPSIAKKGWQLPYRNGSGAAYHEEAHQSEALSGHGLIPLSAHERTGNTGFADCDLFHDWRKHCLHS